MKITIDEYVEIVKQKDSLKVFKKIIKSIAQDFNFDEKKEYDCCYYSDMRRELVNTLPEVISNSQRDDITFQEGFFNCIESDIEVIKEILHNTKQIYDSYFDYMFSFLDNVEFYDTETKTFIDVYGKDIDNYEGTISNSYYEYIKTNNKVK